MEVTSDKRRASGRLASPVDAHVGEMVRRRRIGLGLSQEKLAVRLGLSFQQIQKYERGRNRVGAGRLYDLAKALDVPVQYFFSGLDRPDAAQSSPQDLDYDVLGSLDGVELVRAFARIVGPEQRRAVVALVAALSLDSQSQAQAQCQSEFVDPAPAAGPDGLASGAGRE